MGIKAEHDDKKAARIAREIDNIIKLVREKASKKEITALIDKINKEKPWDLLSPALMALPKDANIFNKPSIAYLEDEMISYRSLEKDRFSVFF